MNPLQSVQCADTGNTLVLNENLEAEYQLYFARDENKIYSHQLNTEIKVGNYHDELCTACGYKHDGKFLEVSPLDMVWCFIVSELIKYGYQQDKITWVHNMLKKDSDKFKVSMPKLEFCLAYCLREKKPLALILSRDNNVRIIDTLFDGANELSLLEESCIQISIHSLLQKAIPEFRILPKRNLSLGFRKDIAELLRLIKMGRFSEITLTMEQENNGHIKLIDAMEILTNNKRIEELKREYPYQEITIKQDDYGNERIIRRLKKLFKNDSN
jgi:hypothetical protein